MNFLIPDKKLTDNEIKKALKHCADTNCNCEKCSLYVASDDDCKCARKLKLEALDLINRYEEKNSNLTSDLTSLQNNLTSLQAENEDLKTENLILSQKRFNIFERIEYSDKLKAKAYKECIEKVKEELADWVGADNSINYSRIEKVCDNLLKEMAGANNET